MNRERLPRILVVGGSPADNDELVFLSKGFLAVETEISPMIAVNRLGLEDYDMVVVDPDTDDVIVTASMLDFLDRVKVPFIMLKQSDNGNLKRLSDSGRFRMRSCSKQNFVDSVLRLVEQPA